MGKVRSKRSKGKGRVRPTGLPSVKETEQQVALEPRGLERLPLLEKLSSANAGDRESSCRSLAHLVLDKSVVGALMSHQVVRKLGPLMLDCEASVRMAAAGTLRNLSLALEGELCAAMADQGVMVPLCQMLRECVMSLQGPRPGHQPTKEPEGEKRGGGGGEGDDRQQNMVDIAEQGLNLLLNLSEQSPAVVVVFNQEEVLPLILSLLQTVSLPPSLVTTAAQCLHTVTEDNTVAAQSLSSSQEHLSLLEGLLASSSDPPTGQDSLLKISVSGIFCNILPSLPAPLHPHILRGVLSVLLASLDSDVSPHLHILTSAPPPTPPQPSDASIGPACTAKKEHLLEDVLNCLRATHVALEVLANVCYVEGEGGGWEDVEEEEMVGDVMEGEGDQGATPTPEQLSPSLVIALELGLHEKVWKKCQGEDPAIFQLCSTIENGDSIVRSLYTIHSRSLVALQNLVAALPVEVWEGCGGLATIFSSLLSLVVSGSPQVNVESALGALLVVGKKMRVETEVFSSAQLGQVAELGLTATQTHVRADVMELLGTVGKMALRHSPPSVDTLNVIGCTLRDCIAKDSSLWVVSQALDSVFDVFGDDNCPRSVFVSVGLMPVLKTTKSMFKARLRLEGRFLSGQAMAVMHNSQANLPRFLNYMATRTATV